jgi:adenine C2-methylase RlmN of 23S rRNA A2503 and tRNA A37
LNHWKIKKVVKDEEDYKNVVSAISRNFEQLKKIYVNLFSTENYPYISRNEITMFCEHIGIFDG